jgi:hypothetical protein
VFENNHIDGSSHFVQSQHRSSIATPEKPSSACNDIRELIEELDLKIASTERLQNLLERLSDLLDHSNHYVRLWLTSPHPDFGGKTPIFYLQQNKIEVVENLVEAIEIGQIG